MTGTFSRRLNANLPRLRRLAEQHAESAGVSRGVLLFKLSGLLADVDRDTRDEVVFLATYLARVKEMIRGLRNSEAARQDIQTTREALERQLQAPGVSPLFCRDCAHTHRSAACATECACDMRHTSAACACEASACCCARERLKWWISASMAEVR
jgi:hypothetical protein